MATTTTHDTTETDTVAGVLPVTERVPAYESAEALVAASLGGVLYHFVPAVGVGFVAFCLFILVMDESRK
jgi:uncharacterized membrane protein YdbT with pleckstrin-like domain